MASNALIQTMAERNGVTEAQFYSTLMATVMPGNVTNEQVLAFLQVAGQHGLNPLTKEIYAFPSKGGIQPVVSIDGWVKLANSNPQFDGLTHTDNTDASGNLVSVTCAVHRKDRAQPITATEYMDECRRNTEPWKNWPRRMLRHKATIQAIRYAFGFAGIIDPDEYERYHEAPSADVTAQATADKADQLKQKIAAAGGSGILPPSPESLSPGGGTPDTVDEDTTSDASSDPPSSGTSSTVDDLWASGAVNHTHSYREGSADDADAQKGGQS